MALLSEAQIEKLLATGNFERGLRRLRCTPECIKNMARWTYDEKFEELAKIRMLDLWIDLTKDDLESACFSHSRRTGYICGCGILFEYARGCLAC